jgi:predicted RNase H-like HicB family nuclease
MKYTVTLVESDEGWAVWCDQLPGCCSQGATRDEALVNIREAISNGSVMVQVPRHTVINA